MDQSFTELLNTLCFSQSYQEVMANQSYQQNLSGFLQYVFDDAHFDFIIHIIGGQYTFHGMGGIHCTTPASNTDCVGVIKCVLTLTKSTVTCSYATVLIKSQPPTKDLGKLTIEDPIPTTCHDSSWRSGWSVDFRVHNTSL